VVSAGAPNWRPIGTSETADERRDGERQGAPTTPTTRMRMATEIKAHITGTIWKIKAAAGDAVDEGDTLVIIESMKMEMPIEAQDPGTVKEVRCKEGQPVTEGEVLMVIDD
jgi:acetyl-CoA carboxylase biotin carboxyl carrier protein